MTAGAQASSAGSEFAHGVELVHGVVFFCGQCRGQRGFEQPQCEDGHEDCVDWGCVECGTAIVLARPAAVPVSPAAALPALRQIA